MKVKCVMCEHELSGRGEMKLLDPGRSLYCCIRTLQSYAYPCSVFCVLYTFQPAYMHDTGVHERISVKRRNDCNYTSRRRPAARQMRLEPGGERELERGH